MTKIANLEDFQNITSRITSFSHAYLFNVNSLDSAYPYVKDFAKSLILQEENDDFIKEDISYKIDNDEFDDLYMMYNCKNHIISNSTFGWWASFLCDNTDNITIAPQQWVKTDEQQDILRDKWICI